MSDFNDKVISEFRANSGRVAAFGDSPMIVLHTVGARSGQEHVVPMVCFDDGSDLVVVASAAGAPRNPAWYHNLMAHPTVEAEVGDGSAITERRLNARELTGADRDRLWAQITARAPGFAEYQTKTDRLIPVLALSPA